MDEVRRQYSLPNCTLVLEGSSDKTTSIDSFDGRRVLSTLKQATCHFAGIETKIQGGRVFFENLVRAVSAHAQQCLSSVSHPPLAPAEGEQITLTQIESNLHLLTWHPPEDVSEQPVELQLTTVQLFDLVEAIDQFFADSHTLPDFCLKLQPVSRRYRQSDLPFIQRMIPLALGVSGLALAALACFLIPIPEVKKPEPKPAGSPTETVPESKATPTSP